MVCYFNLSLHAFFKFTSTNLFLKKEGEVEHHKSGYLSDNQSWQFAMNPNKCDSNWNSSLSIPDKIMESDSFAYEEESAVKISQASFLYY